MLYRRKVLRGQMLKSVEWCVLRRDATLREQESPQAPIPALSTVHMHRASSMDTAGMLHRHVLIAKPRDTPIAAKTASVNCATRLNVPEQNSGRFELFSIGSAEVALQVRPVWRFAVFDYFA